MEKFKSYSACRTVYIYIYNKVVFCRYIPSLFHFNLLPFQVLSQYFKKRTLQVIFYDVKSPYRNMQICNKIQKNQTRKTRSRE